MLPRYRQLMSCPSSVIYGIGIGMAIDGNVGEHNGWMLTTIGKTVTTIASGHKQLTCMQTSLCWGYFHILDYSCSCRCAFHKRWWYDLNVTFCVVKKENGKAGDKNIVAMPCFGHKQLTR